MRYYCAAQSVIRQAADTFVAGRFGDSEVWRGADFVAQQKMLLCATNDAVLRNNNMIDAIFLENADKVKPMFLENINTLIVPNVRDKTTDAKTDEHSTFDLGERNTYKMTDAGKVLFAAERNAIVKVAVAAIEHKPIPTSLITGRGVKLSELIQNTDTFMRSSYHSPQIQVHDYQK